MCQISNANTDKKVTDKTGTISKTKQEGNTLQF